MRFSIITICFNEEKRIKGTISSVKRQVFTDYEYIIKDGASCDMTVNIVDAMVDHNRTKVISKRDTGIYAAMNQALEYAEGEYICFLNCGDYFCDEKTLKRVNDYILENDGFDFYYGDAVIINPDKSEHHQTCANIEQRLHDDYIATMASASFGIIHQAVFANKKCFSFDRFNEEYKLRAELDWYYKCLINNCRIRKMNFLVCEYAYGGMSEKIASASQNYDETLRIIKSYGFDPEEYKKYQEKRNQTLSAFKTIYNKWLILNRCNISIVDYLRHNGIRRIGIYGYGELGCHLINEMRNSDIDIVFVSDRLPKKPYSGIPVVRPEDVCEQCVDLLIVTTISGTSSIVDDYRNRQIKTESIDDIIDSLLYDAIISDDY